MKTLIYGGCAGLAMVLGSASAGSAALLASDTFGKTTGTTLDSAGNYGSNWSSSWTSTAANAGTFQAGLTPTVPGETFTGGSARLIGTSGVGSSIEYREMSSSAPATTSSTVFASFFVQRTNGADGSQSLFSLFAGATAPGTGGSDVVDPGYQAGSGNTFWGMFVGGTWFASTIAATTNTTLMVVELDYNGGGTSDVAKLYIDPTSTSAAPTLTVSNIGLLGSGTTGVNEVRFFSGSSTGSTTTYWGDVNVGTAFSDVVPEPTSLAVLAAGAGAMLIRRRRGTLA